MIKQLFTAFNIAPLLGISSFGQDEVSSAAPAFFLQNNVYQ